MTAAPLNVITDVSPWPSGRGFAGGSIWWKHVLSQDERKRLDNLMGIALLDAEIGKQLLAGQDDTLYYAFGISKETQERLQSIQATTLVDFAQAITCVIGD